jgi:predicted nucleic acid-binding protein
MRTTLARIRGNDADPDLQAEVAATARPPQEQDPTLSPLPIDIVDVTAERAFQAAELKSTYKLYYVDSFAAAVAFERKAILMTSASEFRRLGHALPMVWLKV